MPESSGLSEDALADIVQDYSSAVKKFDSEDVDIVEADALASTGSLSTWFDCIKQDFCSVADSKKAPLEDAQEYKPSQDVAPESVTKSRKARKSAVKEQSHAQHDSEMDDGAPVLIDEKRKRRCVLSLSISIFFLFSSRCFWSGVCKGILQRSPSIVFSMLYRGHRSDSRFSLPISNFLEVM